MFIEGHVRKSEKREMERDRNKVGEGERLPPRHEFGVITPTHVST